MAEAPEGIVLYSWSGQNPMNDGLLANTGIQIGVNAYVDTRDVLGKPFGNFKPDYRTTEYLQLTDSLIETLDLISEGLIDGPLSGRWVFSGNLGQTGWSSGYFSGYAVPDNSITSLTVSLKSGIKDSLAIYVNGNPIKDDNLSYISTATSFDILSYAASSGITIKSGDNITFATKNKGGSYSLSPWTTTVTFTDTTQQIVTGGSGALFGTDTGPFPTYHANSGMIVNVPAKNHNVAWLRSVYWNKLPVLSDAGQYNFQNVDLNYSLGTPNGDVLQQLTNEESTSRSIGTRLYAGDENTQVFRILNQNCKGVIVNIRFSSLSNTNSNNGNIERTSVQYQIAYRPIFSSVSKVTQFSAPVTPFVFGKITSAGGYINSTRIDFDLNSFIFNNLNINDSVGFLNESDFVGWEVKISRSTPDSTSALLSNSSIIDSLTELYGSQFSYPNSSIVRATFDGKFFSSVPERAFECNFIKVSIPANYDPILRTYATGGYGTTNGYWNGTFASGKAWTNNPAWCFYDLITNNRYGLGKFVDNIDINVFDLYNIAQYCDGLVADGYGSIEPRFTSNVWIAQKEEAYKVINDMASIFRGFVYYFNGNLNATQDCPKSPRTTFTNANVENGDFNYSTTSKKTRQSVAIVRYNDPKNFYSPAIEYIENLDAIRRYGVRELPITAFGCTSRGQAIRLGKWALYSNNLETETVTFTAGLEANLLRCGDLFEIVDYNRKLKRYGGRALQINNTGNTGIGYTGASIVLDSQVQIQSGVQYSISFVTPTFYYDTSQVTGLTSNDYSNIYRSFLQTFTFSGDNSYVSGNYSIVNLPTGLDSNNYNISGNPIWSIELGPNSLNYTGNYYFSSSQKDYYRVLNMKEADTNKYEIVGLLYYPDKFNLIETGLMFTQSQVQNIIAVPSSPYGMDNSISAYRLNNSQSYINYSFIMDDFSNVSSYQVFATTGSFVGNSIPDSSLLVAVLPASIVTANYLAPTSGNYKLRVYSYNQQNGNYSTGCASGSVLVTNNLPINDVLVGGLIVN
jgi:hypothetical protein